MIDKRDAAPESQPERPHLGKDRAGGGVREWLHGHHSTSLDKATAIRGPIARADRHDPRTRSRAGRPAAGGVHRSESGLPLRAFLFSGSDGVPSADGLDEEVFHRTSGAHGDGRWRRGAGLRRPGLHEVGEPGHRCRVHESVLAQLDGCSLTGAHLLLMADRLLSAPEGQRCPTCWPPTACSPIRATGSWSHSPRLSVCGRRSWSTGRCRWWRPGGRPNTIHLCWPGSNRSVTRPGRRCRPGRGRSLRRREGGSWRSCVRSRVP